MNKRYDKQIFVYIAFAVGLLALVTHLELVLDIFSYIAGLVMPVAAGLIAAFILNVPVSGFEKLFMRLLSGKKHKPDGKTIHGISILLSLVCVALVFVLLGVLVFPKVAEALRSIIDLAGRNWPLWLEKLNGYNIDTSGLMEFFAEFDWKNILDRSADSVKNIIGSISSAAASTVSVLSITVTAVIIALYTLSDRDRLVRHARKILYAYTKPSFADRLMYVCRLIKNSYTRFLTTQCAEAVILGVLIAAAFGIFRLPYAALVGTVTAICALVPYIGAFLSCALAVVLTLMTAPAKAVTCLAVYLAVQFIETQFIYPRVVGGSVGLSPLLTLVAVIIGGKLFGLFGMIFFIPLVSSIYTLIKEDVSKRLAAMGEETEGNRQVL